MFGNKNYYCLVAGLREYTLDSDTKGFNAREIIDEILEELTGADARVVRLLYGYYDCENIIALRASREAYNPLGNLTREQLEAELSEPKALPERMARVINDTTVSLGEIVRLTVVGGVIILKHFFVKLVGILAPCLYGSNKQHSNSVTDKALALLFANRQKLIFG